MAKTKTYTHKQQGVVEMTYSTDVEDVKSGMVSHPKLGSHSEAFDNGKPCYLNLIRHYGGGGRGGGGGGIEFDMTSKLTQPIILAEDDDYIATYCVPTKSNEQITNLVMDLINEARLTANNRNAVRLIKKKLKKYVVVNPLVGDMPCRVCVVKYSNGRIGTKTLWDMEKLNQRTSSNKKEEQEEIS
tara:strand:+ start:51 stop:608 length:558 start_codon:yes stop_codon:yes gene_type:complete